MPLLVLFVVTKAQKNYIFDTILHRERPTFTGCITFLLLINSYYTFLTARFIILQRHTCLFSLSISCHNYGIKSEVFFYKCRNLWCPSYKFIRDGNFKRVIIKRMNGIYVQVNSSNSFAPFDIHMFHHRNNHTWLCYIIFLYQKTHREKLQSKIYSIVILTV